MPEPDVILVLRVVILTGIICGLISWLLARYSIQAIPNRRSAHQTPIATAGGLALIIAVGAGVMALDVGAEIDTTLLHVVLGLSGMSAALGFIDDIREVPAKLKFGLLGLISLIAAFYLGPVNVLPLDGIKLQLPWLLAMAGTGLWVFTMVNSVNFMDGGDGVVPLSSLVATAGMLVLSVLFENWLVFWLTLLLVAGLIGFLPFNTPKARLFLGDTGSLFIGTWLAANALLLIKGGPESAVWLMPLMFMPYLSDVLLTMAWRLRQRHNLLQAHNDHLYQLAIKAGQPHIRVALSLSVQIGLSSFLAILLYGSATSAFLGFAASAVFALLVHWQLRHTRKAQ